MTNDNIPPNEYSNFDKVGRVQMLGTSVMYDIYGKLPANKRKLVGGFILWVNKKPHLLRTNIPLSHLAHFSRVLWQSGGGR